MTALLFLFPRDGDLSAVDEFLASKLIPQLPSAAGVRSIRISTDAINRTRSTEETSITHAIGRRSAASAARRRGTRNTPIAASAYSTIMKSGSTTVRPTSRLDPAPRRPSVLVTDGCHSHCAPSPASFAFSPGCSRMNVNARCR